jgi:hypothetical protein
MGTAGRSACAQPCRSNGRGPTGFVAKLGSARVRTCQVGAGDVGLSRRSTSGTGRAGACLGRVARRRLAGRSYKAGRPNLGGATSAGPRAAARYGPATLTGRIAELGRTSARRAGLGRASPCCAAATPVRRAATRRGCATTATGCRAAGADLGIATRREHSSRAALGRCVGPAARAFVGRCATDGGTAGACRHRLGSARRKPTAPSAACPLVERAGGSFFMGRPQDSGTCRATRAVLVTARRFAGMVGSGRTRSAGPSRRMGASSPARRSAHSGVDHIGRAGSGRCGACRSRGGRTRSA